MTKPKFKVADFIYYHSKEDGTVPGIVRDVRYRGPVRGWWVLMDNGRWVKSSNCIFQIEWAEREGITIEP